MALYRIGTGDGKSTLPKIKKITIPLYFGFSSNTCSGGAPYNLANVVINFDEETGIPSTDTSAGEICEEYGKYQGNWMRINAIHACIIEYWNEPAPSYMLDNKIVTKTVFDGYVDSLKNNEMEVQDNGVVQMYGWCKKSGSPLGNFTGTITITGRNYELPCGTDAGNNNPIPNIVIHFENGVITDELPWSSACYNTYYGNRPVSRFELVIDTITIESSDGQSVSYKFTDNKTTQITAEEAMAINQKVMDDSIAFKMSKKNEVV